MDWQEFGRKNGFQVDGAMGAYYRPQIEEAMKAEAARAAQLGNQPGFQANDSLQGGNSISSLMGQANADRTTQGANPYMPPTMYAGGTNKFNESGPSVPNSYNMAAQSYGVTQQPTGAKPSFATGGLSAPPQQQPANPYMTQSWSPNPALQPMFQSIMDQNTQNLKRNVLPQIGRNSVANGSYGSSRQAQAEGIAMGDLARANTNAMANIGYQDYQFGKNYGLASDALDLNVYNSNQNWMNQGQQNQMNALGQLLNWNQTYGVGNATNNQNTPLNYWQQFSNTGAQLGGMGGTNSQTMQGNPLLSGLGGAIAGYNMWNSFYPRTGG